MNYFNVLRATVRQILSHAEHFEWSLQGFGMLRAYLSPDIRMHIWSTEHVVPDVSVIHDHPWDFTSYVICGEIRNVVYNELHGEEVAGNGPYTHHEQRILCGVGGGMVGELASATLCVQDRTLYATGHSYNMRAEQLHESQPIDGTVTIISRAPREDADHARVFFPLGTQWVSAEPRVAMPREVRTITGKALARMRLEQELLRTGST